MKQSLFLLFFLMGKLSFAQNIGINTQDPLQQLDVNGKIKIGNDNAAPVEGSIRYNSFMKDFEGFNGTNWVSLTASYSSAPSVIKSTTAQYLGSSVAIYGNYAVVGAAESLSTCGPTYTQTGRIYVYKKVGNEWLFFQDITPVVNFCHNNLGEQVAIFENYIAIAERKTFDNSGNVYIYKLIGNTWTYLQSIQASIFLSSEYFGSSISLYGNYLAVGAKGLAEQPGKIGRVYVFENNGNNFIEVQRIDNPDNDTHDRFGFTVAIDSTHLIVGSPSAVVGGNAEQGKVFTFKKQQGGNWIYANTLIRTLGEPYDHFGESVTLDKENLIIGCPDFDIGGVLINTGAAFLITKDPQGEFTMDDISIITDPEEASGKRFGFRVAVNDNKLIVAAWGSGNNGSAVLYTKENNQWGFKRIIERGVPATNFYWIGIAVNGFNYGIGSPLYPDNFYPVGKIALGDIRY
ncbi:MAG: hypothetical protein ACKVOW_02885 [Chitinophagaceae bacterium]